jgi:short-subunit dehydrogenase
VTGASAGIGAACVEIFARNGWDVVAGARRVDRLEALAKQIVTETPDAKVLPVACNVNEDGSVAAAVAAIRDRFGRLDALVNNAGVGTYGCVGDTPLDEFRSNMETNYFGVLRCSQAALPLLRDAARESRSRYGAAIIMISSFCGRRSVPEFGAYGGSKYALEGLSESLRLELRHERISVSVVNPGVVKTEFFGRAGGTRPAAYVPPERGMTGPQVARVVLRLTRRPRRNVYLTLECKVGVFLQWLMPSVFDYFIWRAWRKGGR